MTWDGGSSLYHHKIPLQPPASSLCLRTHAGTTCSLSLCTAPLWVAPLQPQATNCHGVA